MAEPRIATATIPATIGWLLRRVPHGPHDPGLNTSIVTVSVALFWHW